MNHFKTQQEVWKHLVEGGAVAHVSNKEVYKFKNGVVDSAYSFFFPNEWSPHIEPVAKTKDEISCEDLIKQGQCPCGGTTSYGCSVTGCPLYVEKKTKVWRWEMVVIMSQGSIEIKQSSNLFTEKHAAEFYPGYTKVPNSEREI